MTDTAEAERDDWSRLHQALDQVSEWSGFEDMRWSPPSIAFQCPSKHPIVTVRLMTVSWFPLLETVGRVSGWVTSADVGGVYAETGISNMRMKLKCRECNYNGTHTQGGLLQLYVSAAQNGEHVAVLKK